MVQDNEDEFVGMGNATWFKDETFRSRIRVHDARPINHDLKLADIYSQIKAGKKIQLAA
jgi:hypothetical protein